MKALFALALAGFLTGCLSISEHAELADGSTTRTRGLSFWSKTGLPLADASKELVSTNSAKYSRDTRLEGLETDAETESVAAMSGLLGSAFGAQNDTILALLQARQAERDSERDQVLVDLLGAIREDLARMRTNTVSSP